MKFQRYISFDLDTKGKDYKVQHYQQIRTFFINNGFNPLKDSNYLSARKLSEEDIKNFNKQFVRVFPDIIDSLTKFDWTVFRPDLVNHAADDLKTYKKEIIRKERCINRERGR